MPKNKFQKLIFALMTVAITVHAYVFFSLYVVHGNTFKQLTGEQSVLSAIKKAGGVPVLGRPAPIWAVVLIEFLFAVALETLLGSPLSLKIVLKKLDPRSASPALFETAITCATVIIMCPAMSFIAAVLYYNYQSGFNVCTLFVEWLKLVCFNLPFAFFTQICFIQPFVRRAFGLIFSEKKTARKAEKNAAAA